MWNRRGELKRRTRRVVAVVQVDDVMVGAVNRRWSRAIEVRTEQRRADCEAMGSLRIDGKKREMTETVADVQAGADDVQAWIKTD